MVLELSRATPLESRLLAELVWLDELFLTSLMSNWHALMRGKHKLHLIYAWHRR